MFKVSQEIRLNTGGGGGGGGGGAGGNNSNARNSFYTGSGVGDVVGASGNALDGHNSSSNNNNSNSNNDSENDVCIFGKYQRTPDVDEYPSMEHNVFVAPELTDTSKVQLLHFPNGAVRLNSDVNFNIKRNGVKGNFEVKLENPAGLTQHIPLQILDPERFKVDFHLNQAGLYKVHIKCNSVSLPKSPFIIICITGEAETTPTKLELPVFKSDASKVIHRGLGLNHICLHERNEFTVDASTAGNNILFVGICGPDGPCDEVVIKHTGRNVYKVNYTVRQPGDYVLAAKWGDEHIPGSPFQLNVM